MNRQPRLIWGELPYLFCRDGLDEALAAAHAIIEEIDPVSSSSLDAASVIIQTKPNPINKDGSGFVCEPFFAQVARHSFELIDRLLCWTCEHIAFLAAQLFTSRAHRLGVLVDPLSARLSFARQ